MLAAPKQLQVRSAPLIGGLLILILGAIALALPPSPIARQENSEGIGALQAAGLFSDGLAEQNARNGYGYLALDITGASRDRDALWRQNLEVVAARRYPVWAWIEVAQAAGDEEKLLGSMQVGGVFLHGPGAENRASALRASRPNLPILVVRAKGSGDRQKDAIALDLDSYLQTAKGEYAHPILIADQLGAADVARALEHASKLAGEDGKPTLLVARIPIVHP